jgi:hypothetical protein
MPAPAKSPAEFPAALREFIRISSVERHEHESAGETASHLAQEHPLSDGRPFRQEIT